jgi:dipeptidase
MIEVLTDHSDGENPDEDRVVDVAGDLSICLHRNVGESTGASTASLVADLCATDERLPIYWTGLYSPCMTVFLPNFIEGDLPGILGIGGELESADSPWWDFYRLTQHGVKAGAEVRAEIRSVLANLQQELFESAYEVAKNGRELIDNGSDDAATEMLTKFMAENAQRVISKVKSMVPATASVS